MNGLFSLVPLIIVFPVIGVLINVFFGRRLMPTRDSIAPGVVSTVMAALSFVIAVLMFIALLTEPAGAEVPLFTWMSLQAGDFVLDIPWRMKVDTLSAVMMLVVTGVGTLIHIYAIGYMQDNVEEMIEKRGYDEAEAFDFKRRRYSRFFSFFSLFMTSMLILVTGSSYIMMFVGWEGVGLCSYLLISFWNDDPTVGWANSAAGAKAFIANRVGDFGMIMAIMLMFWTFGTVQFDDVFARAECMKDHAQAECLDVVAAEGDHQEDMHEDDHGGLFGVLARPFVEEGGEGGAHEAGPLPPFDTAIPLGPLSFTLTGIVTAIVLFLLLGATGKSAQIPLFVWLPDAMAGPTPVSALIHAATMVTAGVYMLTRSNELLFIAPGAANVIAIIGGLTAFVAATIAVGQFDMKKVLAYSTISQLGFMVAAVGLGGYIAAIFHLATHAFFKALLFLGAGSVIHGMEHGHHSLHHGHDDHGHDDHGHADEHEFDPQDMRNMGNLRKHMPITTAVYLTGALALAGIPPLAGFWSKDEIVLDAFNNNTFVYVLLTISAFFTAFYMGRQVFMVFFGSERTEAAKHAHESKPIMTYPLIALATLSVIGGAMNLPIKGGHQLGHWLEEAVRYAHIPEFSWTVAISATVLAVVAIGISWLIYGRKPLEAGERDPLYSTGPVFTFLNRKWYWDELYTAILIDPFKRLGDFFAHTLDWNFLHDFVHDSVLATAFQGWGDILSQPIDQGIIDGAVNGIASLISGSSEGLSRTQTGYVRNYALAIALGVVAVMIFLIIRLFA